MFKNFLLSVAALALMVTGVFAEDDLLKDVASLNASSITDAQIAIEDGTGSGLDVDGLAQQAGGEKSDQAIEACFRRFGYGGGYCHYNFYNPCYTYSYCYPQFYCYRPVYYYSYCYPVYTHYWGCY